MKSATKIRTARLMSGGSERMIDVVSTRTSGRKRKMRTRRRSLRSRRTAVWPERSGEAAITMKSKIFQPCLKNIQGFLP